MFFVLIFAISAVTVNGADLTTNDTAIVTSSEDVNIVDQDLSNNNVTQNGYNLNIENSALNNFNSTNDGGNAIIKDSTIKNSVLDFKNNDEIIFKNTRFIDTTISITGAKTLYLINCSFINSIVNVNTTNLLTMDLIINSSSNVSLTSDHIFSKGYVFVNNHSNFHINVTKTKHPYNNPAYPDLYYSNAFSRAYELIGFNGGRYMSHQLIMVNGSSKATGHINGTAPPSWPYFDFLTFSSSDSIDNITGAFNATDHDSIGADLWVEYGSTFFKLPNGIIIEITNNLYSYFNLQGNKYDFSSFYTSIDSGIYNHYQNYESYYFESINYTYEYGIWRSGGVFQSLFFDMMSVYNATGFTNSDGEALLRNNYGSQYYVFTKEVYYYNNIIKIYLNDIYHETYEMLDISYNNWWATTYDYVSGFHIDSMDRLLDAYSGERQYNYTNIQNIFLYQNIKYVDENGTVLDTEDMNILFSLLSYFMDFQAPYSAIKEYYNLYGWDGILMLLNVNMSDPNEVDYMREELQYIIDEINNIIDVTLIGEFGVPESDLWKTIVVPTNSNTTENQTTCNCTSCGNNTQVPSTPPVNNTPVPNTPPVNNTPVNNTPTPAKVVKKADLAITKVKKVKSSLKKKAIVYKITIQNKGKLKSGKTTLALWHIRGKYKTKVKYVTVKALKPGQKITLTVKYSPDNKKHKHCHTQYFVVNPSKNIKESTYKNNKKVLKA